MTQKKKELETNIDICEKKLDRAEKLIGGLGGEKDRWTEAARILGDILVQLKNEKKMLSKIIKKYNFCSNKISHFFTIYLLL
jgi:dynein heavy chain